MRSRARRRCLLLLGCTLLAAACQPLAPQAPAAPAAPQRVLSLCERPAQPAAASQDAEVEASFRAFSLAWLERMRKAGAAKNAPGGRKRILDEFETALRPTGSKQAPWLGVLRYCEQVLRCTGASAASCAPSKSTVVTEIFRFEAGKWVY
jgi:hypothetical protein